MLTFEIYKDLRYKCCTRVILSALVLFDDIAVMTFETSKHCVTKKLLYKKVASNY